MAATIRLLVYVFVMHYLVLSRPWLNKDDMEYILGRTYLIAPPSHNLLDLIIVGTSILIPTHSWGISTRPLSPNTTLVLLSIVLSVDIQTNPVPQPIYPCGVCETAVTWQHRAVCCDQCDIWFHTDCTEICNTWYDHLQRSNVSWLCCRCDGLNVDYFTFHIFELETSNIYSPIACDQSLGSVNSQFSPRVFSTPKHNHGKRRSHRHPSMNVSVVNQLAQQLTNRDSSPQFPTPTSNDSTTSLKNMVPSK